MNIVDIKLDNFAMKIFYYKILHFNRDIEDNTNDSMSLWTNLHWERQIQRIGHNVWF